MRRSADYFYPYTICSLYPKQYGSTTISAIYTYPPHQDHSWLGRSANPHKPTGLLIIGCGEIAGLMGGEYRLGPSFHHSAPIFGFEWCFRQL
jgi:hypothetical protein